MESKRQQSPRHCCYYLNLFKPIQAQLHKKVSFTSILNENLKTHAPVAPLKTSPNVSICIQPFNKSWGRVEQLSFTTHFFAKSGTGNDSQSLAGETSNRVLRKGRTNASAGHGIWSSYWNSLHEAAIPILCCFPITQATQLQQSVCSNAQEFSLGQALRGWECLFWFSLVFYNALV